MDAAWFAILTTVVLAVIAGLIAHIRDDAHTKERLAKLETQADQDHEEIKTLRERFHDVRKQVLADCWDYFKERYEELRRMVVERK